MPSSQRRGTEPGRPYLQACRVLLCPSIIISPSIIINNVPALSLSQVPSFEPKVTGSPLLARFHSEADAELRIQVPVIHLGNGKCRELAAGDWRSKPGKRTQLRTSALAQCHSGPQSWRKLRKCCKTHPSELPSPRGGKAREVGRSYTNSNLYVQGLLSGGC